FTDNAGYTFFGLRRNQRTHVGFGIGAFSHGDRMGAIAQLGRQFVGGVADGHGHGNRHAAFAGSAESGRADVFGGQFHVGIGHDHGVVLGAAQRLHAFAVGNAGLVN